MTAQTTLCQAVGFIPTGGATPSTPTVSLNGTAPSSLSWIGFAFTAQTATSLSATRIYQGGSLGGTGGVPVCTLQSDNKGAPSGTVLDTLTVGTLASASWILATGGTFPLTAGTKYWVVWTNSDAAPATNFLKVTFCNNLVANAMTGDDAATTVNSGTSWTQKNAGGGARFDFADATYLGFPVSAMPALTGTQGVYSANEAGIQFTTPANGKMVIRGLGMFITRSGIPTGNPFFKLYDSSHTLLGSTYPIANGDAFTNTTQWYHRNFDPSTISGSSPTIALSPSTQYTVTLAETTQSDAVANQFRMYAYTFDPDANSLAMIPWGMQADILNGGTWTQTPGTVPLFALLLQSGGEFASSGGGSGGTPILQSAIIQGLGAI